VSDRGGRAARAGVSGAERSVDAEIEALRQQNQELNEQIKILTQGEQRLYRSQNELDRQLRRIEALGDFALQCSASADTDEILREATQLLLRLFSADQVMSLLRTEIGFDLADTGPRRAERAPDRRLPPVDDIASYLDGLSGPLVARRGDSLGDGLDVARLFAWLNEGELCSCAEGCVDLALVPLRLGDGRLYGVLVFRSGRRPRSFHVEVPTERHRPFLQLVGTHIGRALDNVLLKRDLRDRSAELADTNQRLRTSIDDLAQTQDQLLHAGKMEAIGQLAGGIAHDFNNLLTVILSYATLLGEGRALVSDRRLEIEQILGAAERAANLTRQLLTFSRREEARPRVLAINDVVNDTAIMLRRLIGENISLELRLDPAIACVVADRGQLEQVIMNLAVNARDAMPGGGRLRITTRPVASGEVPGEDDAPASAYVGLEFSDTGHGIDAETRARVFEPFFTTRSAGEGTGMGLAIVYGIVQQSSGQIQIDSAPGQGAVFTIYLPVAADTAPTAVPEQQVSRAPVAAATILLVEDEEGIRLLGQRVLEAAGYAVITAADGDEALGYLRAGAGSVDLLLTDVVMPRLGGVELAARLRTERPEIRVMFMSGYPGGAHRSLQATPVEGYLRKPFTPRQLLEAVAAALDR